MTDLDGAILLYGRKGRGGREAIYMADLAHMDAGYNIEVSKSGKEVGKSEDLMYALEVFSPSSDAKQLSWAKQF